MSIAIVGLGPGDPGLLTREAWETLTTATEIYVRTAHHPTVAGLPSGLTVHSFDQLYESVERPEDVYPAIADRVLKLAQRSGGVVYAVPGHPAVGEASVALIRTRAAENRVRVRIIPGLSFVEPVLSVLGVDALPNLAVADAIEVAARYHPPFGGDHPAILAQLFSQMLASDVKLTLMNEYPDEHEVALVHSAGTDDELVEWLPLHAVDRSPHIAHLTALYIPPRPEIAGFSTLQNTVAHLRAPDGCPWDREQTHQTLRPNLLEEAYETLAALDASDPQGLREELGDLLLQIVLQTQIAIDSGEFQMADVIGGINAKLVRRHPHVFGDLKVDSVDTVFQNWEALKATERANDGNKQGGGGVLSGVPATLPALAQAGAYQARAARVGFDWQEVSGVVDKVREELTEVQQAANDAERTAEIGDLLFAVVNWARWLNVEPESALREANVRFRRRFETVEAEAQANGRRLADMSLEEMDALWEVAKEQLS